MTDKEFLAFPSSITGSAHDLKKKTSLEHFVGFGFRFWVFWFVCGFFFLNTDY